MLQYYNTYKLLQEFFYFPRKNFQIRELSRRIRLGQPSVINHLTRLIKEDIILKEKMGFINLSGQIEKVTSLSYIKNRILY